MKTRPVIPGARIVSAAFLLSILLGVVSLAWAPRPVAAAGEPSVLLLVDAGSSNPFGPYLAEILAAEGVNDVEVQPLASLSSALLAGRSTVILAESSPSTAQAALLDAFVTGGGGLIAMRPAATLAATLGIAVQSGTTSEGYLRITDPTLGAGLYGDTMQFHGAASRYALAGATEVAALYSSRTTAAGFPAVTIADRGAGRAAMFAYDLARSVVLTRQGNPANANVDTDGDGVIRTIDLFRNWTDLERTRVPQADVQQRLLLRLIESVGRQPLPRLWYFPGSAPTVFVITADAHANPESYYQAEIDALTQHGVTGTFYLSPAGEPSTAAVDQWRAQGFDFAPHPYVDGGYASGVDSALSWFQARFGFQPRTVRTHQVRWQGWSDAASILASRGIAMDFNFYQWGSWLQGSSGPALGYLSGSGQPMRFVDSGGNILPIYQQHTSLVDEFMAPGIGVAGYNLDQALAASRAVIDDSVNEYHVPIAVQYHVDYFYPDISTWGMGSTDYALQRGAVSLHSDAWLTFVQQREATNVANSSWSANTLTFDATAGGANQTLLLPLQYRGSALSELRIDGAATGWTTRTVNGVAYAVVPVATASYAATYAADTTAPTVTATTPAAGATNVPLTTPISVTFSEVMQRPASQAAFSLSPATAGSFSWNSAGTIMTFTPASLLAANTSYSASIGSGALDLAGNPLAAPVNWSFTTATITPPPSVTNVSPVAGPIAGGTVVTISGANFTGATAVRFGALAATSFSVGSDTSITATAPAQPAGAVHVTVTTPAGTSPLVANDQYTYVDASSVVAIAAVDPGVGTTAGGNTVTISGAGFDAGTSVSFDGVPATGVTALSTTRLSAVVPAHAAGAVNVTVTGTGGGTATLTNGYTYVACPASCATQTTSADFGVGTTGSATTVVASGDGEVALLPTASAEFEGTTLPAGWSATAWSSGGGVSVGGGSATVDGALLATSGFYAPGRAIEFEASFSGAPHQHAGFGIDLNGTPWAIFSTGPNGTGLLARTSTGSATIDTPISGGWLGTAHRYRIEWGAASVRYFIDGSQVAEHAATIAGQMRPVASDGAVGGASLTLGWLRMTPYAASGSYLSRPIDAGGNASWDTIAWSASVPAGTTLAVAVRAGSTPTPDASWSAFVTLPATGAAPGVTGRYLQYRIDLATSDPGVTPALRDLMAAFTVTGPLSPTVTSVSPASGTNKGGTAVTIGGSSFAAGATVSFGGVAATNVVVVNATTITATTPAHAAGAVDVVVTNPDNGSGTLPAGYTYVAGTPAVSGVAPNAGSVLGGTEVTISGTDFSGATAVTFGAASATFSVSSDTQIVAVAPPGTLGTVDIRVTTPGGTSAVVAADQFTYLQLPPAPSVFAVDPGTGSTAGGETVTITGASFSAGIRVDFGSSPATNVVVLSASRLTARVPAGAAGTVNVTVRDLDGQQGTLVGGYTRVECARGCVTDGSTAELGAGTAGSGAAVTTVADGEVVLTPLLGSEFAGNALPSGFGVSPWDPAGSAVVNGGTLSVDAALVATSAYYTPGRSVEFVATFASAPFQHIGLGDDLNASPWAIFSTGSGGTTLFARSNGSSAPIDTPLSPSLLGAPHRFRIDWTPSAITFWVDGAQVAAHPTAVPGEMRPVISDGPVGGASLNVDWLRVTPYASAGSFESRVLDAGRSVIWGALAWSSDVPAGTGLTVSVRTGSTATPDGSWTAYAPLGGSGALVNQTGRYLQYRVDLTTATPDQTAVLRDLIASFAAVPEVTGISPTTGSTLGGTTVTITGTAFTGATSVRFGTLAATSFAVVSDTTITASAPANATGSAAVTVSNFFGSSQPSAAAQFSWATPPAVSGVSPTIGSTAGGTTLTISGTGFATGAAVTVGGAAATSVTVVSATTITAVTPPGTAGAATIVVTNPDGLSGTLAGAFSYRVAPAIGAVSPTGGSTAGGTAITITGSGFVAGATVTIGGTAATAVSVSGSTTITATTPARPAGPANVVVTNPDGLSATLANGYIYSTPPVVSGVSPTIGSTAGGTTITISGTGFAGGATVTLGGTAATGVTVVNATTITAVTPARAAGTVGIVVTNPGGLSSTLANAFTYRVPPAVTGVAPAVGTTAGGTRVTISGSGFASGATVRFGSTLGTSVTVVNATTITVTTPAAAAGSVNVTVTNSDGLAATLTNGFRYSTPTTTNAAPTSTTLEIGSVVSGSVTQLAANDGQDYNLRSAFQLASFTQAVSFYGQAVIPASQRTLTAFSVRYDGGASATGTRVLSMFNFQTNGWEQLVSESQTTADKSTTVALSGDLARFVSSTGQVRLRVRVDRGSFSAWTLQADQMQFSWTYLP